MTGRTGRKSFPRTARRRLLAGGVTLLACLLAACHPGAASTTAPGGSSSAMPSATSSPSPRLSGPARTSAIHWAACSEQELVEGNAQCGSIKVPLDYAHPTGTEITLALSRVVHTVPHAEYLGVVLSSAGQGASGLDLATVGSYLAEGVGPQYDWIGIDPRGTGASRPRLSCDDTITALDRPDYRATTATLQRYWLARSRSYALDCAAKNGPLLAHMSTEDSARDLESVRVALGVAKVSFYGFSQGTYLGEVYASLYPRHLDRLVLDGAVDPRQVWYRWQLTQDVAQQPALRTFFGWVARYRTTYHLGATASLVEQRYTAELDALARHPARGSIGPDELADVLGYATPNQQNWPRVAKALSQLVRIGTVGGFRQFDLGPQDDNGYAVYNATQCEDAPWPRSFATWQADAVATNRTAPFETWANVWDNASCLFWPTPAGVPVAVKLTTVSSALIVADTLDPITPYAASLYVRSIFPGSRLLAIPGDVSDGASLYGGGCELELIADYLTVGHLPARQPGARADATCPAPLAPTPSDS